MKSQRLVVALLLLILVLQCLIVWREFVTSADQPGKSVTQTETPGLLPVESIDRPLLSTSSTQAILSDLISTTDAQRFVNNYYGFFKGHRPLPTLGGGALGNDLLESIHGRFGGGSAAARVSYNIDSAHVRDLMGQTGMNVLVIYPARRNDGSYTFVVAAGTKTGTGSAERLAIINTRTKPRPSDNYNGSNVIYDELGTCPANCPSVQ